MSSEIKVVDEVQESTDHGNGQVEEEEVSKDNIHKAASYGYLEKLPRLVESKGYSVSKFLQWAAHNSIVAAAQCTIKVELAVSLQFPFLMLQADAKVSGVGAQ